MSADTHTITKTKKVITVTIGGGILTAPTKLSCDIYDLTSRLYNYEIVRDYSVDADLDNSQLFMEFPIIENVSTYEADEVWVFGSKGNSIQMGGSKGFWIGTPPLTLPPCHRRFPIMRFGPDPLWDYGLRVERVLFHLYRDYPPAKNMYQRFTRPESCGTLLRPPNGVLEGYMSGKEFFSDCDDWAYYPKFRNKWRMMSSSEWGGTRHGFVHWWLSHIPQGSHKTDGIHDNWWHSIMNMDLIK